MSRGSDTISAYPPAVQGTLLVALLLAGCVWIGGWAIAIVVARTTAAALPAADRVDFFRAFGRAYGIVTTIALVGGFAAGLALLLGMTWTTLSSGIVVLCVVLVVILAVGIVQARRLTRWRTEFARTGDAVLAARIAAEARRGTVLRAGIGLVSIAVLVLGVVRMT